LWASGSTTGVPNEIVKVTARTGDTMTVVRAQEGTTAQAWQVGDTFANYPTAGFYNQLIDLSSIQAQTSNYAADTGTANAGAVALNPVIASLAALTGVPIRVLKQGAANTTAYTLNVNGLGAIAVNIGGLGMVGKELAASRIYEVMYNGSTFDLISAPAFINTQQLVNDSVTNAILAAVNAETMKGNLTGSAGQPYDVTLADLAAALGINLGSAPDHFVLPGGYKVQWGFSNGPFSAPGANHPVTFPIAFTNPLTLLNPTVLLTVRNTDAGTADNVWAQSQVTSLTGFTFQLRFSGSGSPLVDGVAWLAIGI
jgi:hypothetical protein